MTAASTALGCLARSATAVRLHLRESFTLRVLAAEAAVPLGDRTAAKKR